MKVLRNVVLGGLVITVAVFLSFFLRKYVINFDKKLTKDQKEIIERYISDQNSGRLEDSMSFMSTYYFGDRYNDDKLEVYLWCKYSEYNTKDGDFELYNEFNMPLVVTTNIKDDFFEIISYKVPDDGNKYKVSIKELFPMAIRGRVFSFESSKDYNKLLSDHDKMIKVYEDYSKED